MAHQFSFECMRGTISTKVKLRTRLHDLAPTNVHLLQQTCTITSLNRAQTTPRSLITSYRVTISFQRALHTSLTRLTPKKAAGRKTPSYNQPEAMAKAPIPPTSPTLLNKASPALSPATENAAAASVILPKRSTVANPSAVPSNLKDDVRRPSIQFRAPTNTGLSQGEPKLMRSESKRRMSSPPPPP